ncbi:uncharacterized protein [Eurosta solidaginis]|uniref:uncharacterized protein n=1 Tax=Eurosta solidaginis TaxID=178769 RepID=UPI003530E954
MRSWKSNSRKVLLAITGQSTQNDKYIEEPLSRHEKVLGMWWSPAEDVLTFFENFPEQIYDENHIPTKRQMLRIIMTVFDPLGLLGFHIISAKILMQEVWRSGVSWDEPVRIEQQDKWWKWLRCMPAIAKIRVPRCDPLVSGGERIQLHTFVDASVDAYAAVVYLRAEKGSIVSCCLVASKTRVAPLKPLSIPRLELMGAILGLRLSKFISEELSIFIEKRVFWTDSKNVLCWIKSDARKFHQFVAVRVGEILENSRVDEWRWVPSGDNVADEGTKFKHDVEFNGAARWYIGPSFLYQAEKNWPPTDVNHNHDNDKELICHVGLKTAVRSSWSLISVDPQRFSKWEKMRNAQSYVFMFLQKVTKRTNLSKLATLPKINDIAGVECFIIRCCQEEVFAEEIHLLRKGKAVLKTSSIFKDSPYLDEYGLLRVKGRIDAVQHVPFISHNRILPPKVSSSPQRNCG